MICRRYISNHNESFGAVAMMTQLPISDGETCFVWRYHEGSFSKRQRNRNRSLSCRSRGGIMIVGVELLATN